LYASTLIAIWQRVGGLNISWNFDVLGKVMRKRGRFTVDDPSAGDLRVADSCVALMTSKPRPTNPSEMSSAGLVNGRCRITAFIGFRSLR
jgi:hypothetical protein